MKTTVLRTAKACERALIQSLWDHIYRLWIFRKNEDHKNDNRSVAQYKQQALGIRITQQYNAFNTNSFPLNPLQQRPFDIPQEGLLLLSFDIRRALLRSAALCISRATAYNDLARGSHAQHILRNTAGCPPDILAPQ
jgi:hypothetical protein